MEAIQWTTVQMIVASWFISPLLSGLVSALLFWLTRSTVLRPKNSALRALQFYPLLVGLTVAINVFFIIFKGAKRFSSNLSSIPVWIPVAVAIATGVVCGLVLWVTFVRCFLRKRVHEILDRESMPEIVRNVSDATSVEDGTTFPSKSSQAKGIQNAMIQRMGKTVASGFLFDVHEIARTDTKTMAIHDNAEKVRIIPYDLRISVQLT